jgi:zinc/manganese transport system ATP-binding protein
MGAVLAFRGAGVRLGGRWIWRDVDLEVAPGEFVAVLGPNGAGKSTLLKTVLGLLPLSAGTLHVLGAPVHRGDRNIGYLPQRRSFDADLRIRGLDLVRLGLDGARWGFPLPFRSGDALRRVRASVERVGADAYAHRPVGELSGGEQQRLLIAQALISQPRLLLLDEPLESLDISNQRAISALVQDICRDRGVTVLLVAHDVNPILSYLDRVVYVAGGHAVAGRPAEVITTETLTRLYGVPIEVLRASDGRLVVVGQPEAASFHGHEHH